MYMQNVFQIHTYFNVSLSSRSSLHFNRFVQIVLRWFPIVAERSTQSRVGPLQHRHAVGMMRTHTRRLKPLPFSSYFMSLR